MWRLSKFRIAVLSIVVVTGAVITTSFAFPDSWRSISIDNPFESDEHEWLRQIHVIGDAMNEGNDADVLQDALTLSDFAEQKFGPDHEKTLKTKSEVGRIYNNVGRHEEAVEVYTQLIAQAERNLGPTDPTTLTAIGNLGSAYQSLGRFDDAINAYEKVAELARISNDQSILFDHYTLSNLGILYHSIGELEKAESLLRQIYESRKTGLGENHVDTLLARNNLAVLLGDAGEFEKAENHYLSIIDVALNELGPKHPSTLMYSANLADHYRQTGNEAKAEDRLRQVLVDRIDVLGRNHPDTLITMNNLSVLLGNQGRYAEAEKLGLEALNVSTAIYGAYHPETLSLAHNRMAMLSDLGQTEEAIEQSIKLLGATSSVFGEDSPAHLDALNYQAGLLNELGSTEEANAIWQNGWELSKRKFGIEHPDTLTWQNNIAASYIDSGNYERAVEEISKIVSARDRVLGPGHSDSLTSKYILAVALELADRFEEAGDVYTDILARTEQSLHEDHIKRAEALSSYAVYLSADPETFDTAVYFQKEAVNIMQKIRSQMTTMRQEYQEGVRESYRDDYEILQEWLVEAGRFAEADYVGSLLKTNEFFEYMRGEQPSSDELVPLTTREESWRAQLAGWRDRPNMVARQISAINEKQLSGAKLTDLELRQLADLKSQEAEAYSDYKRSVNAWLESTRFIPSGPIAAEAAALQIEYQDDLQGEIGRLQEKVAIIQIVAFEEELHFFLLTADTFKHFEKAYPRSELNSKIFSAREAIQTLDPSARSELETLYKIVFEPVVPELRDAATTKVMLNLQGSLRYIPFAALHDGDSFLVEKFKFSMFTPAARTDLSKSTSVSNAAAFGVTVAHAPFEALPGVAAEIQSIMGNDATPGILTGEIFLDEEFTRESLSKRLALAPPIIHLASHFYMRTGNDAESLLLLGDGDYLTLAEINESIDLRFTGVELLTLSACSTGLNSEGEFAFDVGEGVEVEGFAVLAQRKGADAVLATLWNVADEATADIMTQFYEGFVESGLDKSEALRRAQISTLKNPETRHPYFWAPFILMGNWR